jgi:predicted HTH domain antitoxin
MTERLRLVKIEVPENPEDYYFVTYTSGEHKTDQVPERHDITIEVMVEGRTSLGEVSGIAEERATRLVKALADRL